MVDINQTPQGLQEGVSGVQVTSTGPAPVGQSGDNLGAQTVSAQFSWANRRRVLWASILFCMGSIGYVLGMGLTSSVAETTVTMSFLSLSGMVGSYVFGATWQDVSIVKSGLK